MQCIHILSIEYWFSDAVSRLAYTWCLGPVRAEGMTSRSLEQCNAFRLRVHSGRTTDLAFTAARRAAMSSSSRSSAASSEPLSSSLLTPSDAAACPASAAMEACRRAAARLRSRPSSESSASSPPSFCRSASRRSRGSLTGFTTTGATKAVRATCRQAGSGAFWMGALR